MLDDTDKVVGFLGWANATEATAVAWLHGRQDFSDKVTPDGDCVILNAWAADNGRVHRFILQAARQIVCDYRSIYFKRHYPDGTTRPARLNVTEFIGTHLLRQQGNNMQLTRQS
jgi:hypothetical protein